MINQLIAQVESQNLRKDPLVFEIGDTVDVHTKIQEGDKERIQIFSGIVIARRGGGVNENFTVRRIVAGEGVERIFPYHSPKIAKIEVKRHGKVRRAKLFFLRDRIGKATKLVERVDLAELEAANLAKKSRKSTKSAKNVKSEATEKSEG